VQTVALPANNDITAFQLTAGTFIWSYTVNPPTGGTNGMAASSIPITTTPTSNITPTLIFIHAYGPQGRTGAYSYVALGNNLLAYTSNRELHVMTYQSALDTRLEDGVTELYDPNSVTFHRGWLK
jgi:hypothetical protein